VSSALYNMDVLRRAASVAEFPLLTDPDAVEERRSATCGSRVKVSLRLDEAGQITDIGIEAKACALGQAAAAIFAAHARGATSADLKAITEGWRAYLAGEQDQLPEWPELALLKAGRDYPARHPSMRLAFEAAEAAISQAVEERER
jgi:NifU-like protein involved in Fe-S cluster formation